MIAAAARADPQTPPPACGGLCSPQTAGSSPRTAQDAETKSRSASSPARKSREHRRRNALARSSGFGVRTELGGRWITANSRSISTANELSEAAAPETKKTSPDRADGIFSHSSLRPAGRLGAKPALRPARAGRRIRSLGRTLPARSQRLGHMGAVDVLFVRQAASLNVPDNTAATSAPSAEKLAQTSTNCRKGRQKPTALEAGRSLMSLGEDRGRHRVHQHLQRARETHDVRAAKTPARKALSPQSSRQAEHSMARQFHETGPRSPQKLATTGGAARLLIEVISGSSRPSGTACMPGSRPRDGTGDLRNPGRIRPG